MIQWMDEWIYGCIYGLLNLTNDYGYVYCYGYMSTLQQILFLLKHPIIQLQHYLHWQLLPLLQHMLLQQQIHCEENDNVCIVTQVGMYCEI